MTPTCQRCGNQYDPRREAMGYILCLPCGEHYAKQVTHTIVPLHKSSYIVAPNTQFVRELNPKITHQ